MSKRIIKGLHEALEHAQGKIQLETRTVIIEDIDVSQIRRKFKLTQLEFSKTFGFSLRTLQQWEQKRRSPHGAALVLLKVINYAPKLYIRHYMGNLEAQTY